MSDPKDPFADIDFSFDPDDESFMEVEDDSWKEPSDYHASEPEPAAFDMSLLKELPEEELADVQIIKAWAPNAVSEFAYNFLRDVKEEYDLHGVGHQHYVIRFRNPEGASRVNDFKRTFTVRVSRIRKGALEQFPDMPKFWVTFVRLVPVNADASGNSADWFCTLARMSEAQYKAYARDRAKEQRKGDRTSELLQKSIGVL